MPDSDKASQKSAEDKSSSETSDSSLFADNNDTLRDALGACKDRFERNFENFDVDVPEMGWPESLGVLAYLVKKKKLEDSTKELAEELLELMRKKRTVLAELRVGQLEGALRGEEVV